VGEAEMTGSDDVPPKLIVKDGNGGEGAGAGAENGRERAGGGGGAGKTSTGTGMTKYGQNSKITTTGNLLFLLLRLVLVTSRNCFIRPSRSEYR
jgi:hypothetical protein